MTFPAFRNPRSSSHADTLKRVNEILKVMKRNGKGNGHSHRHVKERQGHRQKGRISELRQAEVE
ncbi:MAG TPA: hypothetical protein VJC12_00885 [Candidatus Paceibacterota bacterium]